MINSERLENTLPLQLVALGGNISANGAPLAQTLAEAMKAFAQEGFMIRAVSRFFSTPCFPAGAGPDYVNAAVALQSPWRAEDVLARLHQIEAAFGRARIQRWGQRTLDLDLIAMGDSVLPDLAEFQRWHALSPSLQAKAAPEQLVLPHPRVQDRAFVLVPLADIARDWVHPVLGQSVGDLLAQLPQKDVAEVVPL